MPSETPAYQVLIVEDEYFIAEDLVRVLRQAGLGVVGPVADPPTALAALEKAKVDFAIVDINLDGAVSFIVASELRKLSIPFLFHTGYDLSVLPAEFSDTVLLRKPNDGEAVVAAIKRQRDGAPLVLI